MEVGRSHDDVVEDFDFQELAASDQIPGDSDVGYRGTFINVRFRAAEKRAILEAARKAGVGHTDWARSVLLEAAGWESALQAAGPGQSSATA